MLRQGCGMEEQPSLIQGAKLLIDIQRDLLCRVLRAQNLLFRHIPKRLAVRFAIAPVPWIIPVKSETCDGCVFGQEAHVLQANITQLSLHLPDTPPPSLASLS